MIPLAIKLYTFNKSCKIQDKLHCCGTVRMAMPHVKVFCIFTQDSHFLKSLSGISKDTQSTLNYMCEINTKSVESCITCSITCWEILMISSVAGEAFPVRDLRIPRTCMANLHDPDMLVLWLPKSTSSGELLLRRRKTLDFAGGRRLNACNSCNLSSCNQGVNVVCSLVGINWLNIAKSLQRIHRWSKNWERVLEIITSSKFHKVDKFSQKMSAETRNDLRCRSSKSLKHWDA